MPPTRNRPTTVPAEVMVKHTGLALVAAWPEAAPTVHVGAGAACGVGVVGVAGELGPLVARLADVGIGVRGGQRRVARVVDHPQIPGRHRRVAVEHHAEEFVLPLVGDAVGSRLPIFTPLRKCSTTKRPRGLSCSSVLRRGPGCNPPIAGHSCDSRSWDFPRMKGVTGLPCHAAIHVAIRRRLYGPSGGRFRRR